MRKVSTIQRVLKLLGRVLRQKIAHRTRFRMVYRLPRSVERFERFEESYAENSKYKGLAWCKLCEL